jgi:syntaxin-binding protein 1
VFFSSPMQKELVAQIKKDSSVLPRIGALSEVTELLCSFLLCLGV